MRRLLASALGVGLAVQLVACGASQDPAPEGQEPAPPPITHCSGPASVAATGSDGVTVIGYVDSGQLVSGDVWLSPLVDDIPVWPVGGARGPQPDALLVVGQPPVRLDGCEEDGSYRVDWPACEGEWGRGIIDHPVDPKTRKAVVEVKKVVPRPTAAGC